MPLAPTPALPRKRGKEKGCAPEHENPFPRSRGKVRMGAVFVAQLDQLADQSAWD